MSGAHATGMDMPHNTRTRGDPSHYHQAHDASDIRMLMVSDGSETEHLWVQWCGMSYGSTHDGQEYYYY